MANSSEPTDFEAGDEAYILFSVKPTNAALCERLRFIDFMLATCGHVKRRYIMEYFGVANAQATRDLRTYRDLAPDNLVLEPSSKAYRATSTFVRKFP